MTKKKRGDERENREKKGEREGKKEKNKRKIERRGPSLAAWANAVSRS
jgi:hypothetical protein